jgi:hypothetical protein
MPVPDVDGGMQWRGYNPRMQYGNLPTNKDIHYFGGSNVRMYRDVDESKSSSKGL